MIEDKLLHDERVRLECIAQAVISEPRATAEGIIAKARKFEKYVLIGSEANG